MAGPTLASPLHCALCPHPGYCPAWPPAMPEPSETLLVPPARSCSVAPTVGLAPGVTDCLTRSPAVTSAGGSFGTQTLSSCHASPAAGDPAHPADAWRRPHRRGALGPSWVPACSLGPSSVPGRCAFPTPAMHTHPGRPRPALALQLLSTHGWDTDVRKQHGFAQTSCLIPDSQKS